MHHLRFVLLTSFVSLFLALSLVHGQNVAGIKALQEKAEAGDLDSQFTLGLRFARGEGVPKNNAESTRWFTKAWLRTSLPLSIAEENKWNDATPYLPDDILKRLSFSIILQRAKAGSRSHQFGLGWLYERGDGFIFQNWAEAVRWYRLAAEQGDIQAQSRLGELYATGKGTPKDAAQAVFWYRKAAEQGDADAQAALGTQYAIGVGVPKNLILAYMWRNLAAAQGSEIARDAREALEADMTPAQIAEAQRLSREWKPKTNP